MSNNDEPLPVPELAKLPETACPACMGLGRNGNPEFSWRCPHCDGTGSVDAVALPPGPRSLSNAPAPQPPLDVSPHNRKKFAAGETRACLACGGAGTGDPNEDAAGSRCVACDGRGWQPTYEVTADPVNNPQHYTALSPEPIDVIETWGLGFHAGNVVKYVARHLHKGTALQDLKKARWYLTRLIETMEKSDEQR